MNVNCFCFCLSAMTSDNLQTKGFLAASLIIRTFLCVLFARGPHTPLSTPLLPVSVCLHMLFLFNLTLQY